MEEKASRTYRIENALVTIHGFSAGTAILNIVSVKDPANRLSIWVSPSELRELGELFIRDAEVICGGVQ